MIHTLETTAPARPAARPGLLLHSSGEEATREDVLATPTPNSTYTWFPLPHREFAPRNAWSLFNAFTEAYKGINPQTLVSRSQALHGLFDGMVGLN